MDPFEVLRRLRAYVVQHERYYVENDADANDWIELCENFAYAFYALDGWMSKGGFSPWKTDKDKS